MSGAAYWFSVCRGLTVSTASLLVLASSGLASASTPQTSEVEQASREKMPKLVAVNLVGLTCEADAMVTLIRELLERRGIAIQPAQQSRLTEQELLTVPRSSDPPLTRIWILMPEPHRAVLYFGQPAHNRYLVRELPMPSGLDEAGREQVAQVVESATLALLSGAPALSRDDFQTGLDATSLASAIPKVEQSNVPPDGALLPGSPSTPALTEAKPNPPNLVPETVKAEPSKGPTEGTLPPGSPRTNAPTDVEPEGASNQHSKPSSAGSPGTLRITPRFGVGYFLQWSGSELKAQHGPSIRAGITLRPKATEKYGLRWPILLAWEPRFAQTYSDRGIDFDTKSQVAWILAGPHYAITDTWTLQAQLGAGCEFVHIVTRPSSESQAVASGEDNRRVPWVRLELGGEIQSGALAFGASAVLDVSLYATHYDVLNDSTTERLFSPWLVRPGIRLGADFF